MTTKLCFSTLGCTEKSMDEVFETAKSFGINALEIRGLSGELDNEKILCFQKENRADTAKKLKAAGIYLPVLGTSATFHEKKSYENALSEGRAAIHIAKEIGGSAIRVFGDRLTEHPEDAIRRVADGIFSLCEYAESYGVDVLLEVHGDFVSEAALMPIVHRCGGHPRFGLIWDVCHTRHSFPDFRAFYALFAPYIRHVHLKDIRGDQHMLPGEGDLPLREIADALEAQGYGGFFSLEWERKWHPSLPPIEQALEKFTKIFRG